MILKNVMVIPPAERPPSLNSEYSRSEDNLFKLYTTIIKHNESLKRLKGVVVSESAEKLYLTLILATNSLISRKGSDGATISYKKNNAPLKSLIETLKGKKGLIRGTIFVKRVNGGGRTILTPSVYGNIDEVVIPQLFAIRLSWPVHAIGVTIKKLRKYIKNGMSIYPGARMIIKKDGKKIMLQHVDEETRAKIASELEFGDLVHRNLIDGDIVLVSRQPVLHRYGIMAVRIKVSSEALTLRFELCTVGPFNADFDGDEGNVYVPLSITTKNEMEKKMLARNHIISIGDSGVHISPIQDNVIGIYLMSKNFREKITRSEFLELVMSSLNYNEEMLVEKFSRKSDIFWLYECIECIFPINFHFIFGNIVVENSLFVFKSRETIQKIPKTAYEKEKNQKVLRSRMFADDPIMMEDTINAFEEKAGIEPPLTKYAINKHTLREMVRTVVLYHGANEANDFIIAEQRMTNHFLMVWGVTCSINDIVIPDTLRNKIKKNIATAMKENEDLLDDFDSGKIAIPLTETAENHYENMAEQITTKVANINHELTDEWLYNPKKINNLGNQVSSKSRGNRMNITSIVDSVGQITSMGKRMSLAYNSRPFMWMPKYAEDLESRGYVTDPYSEGLTTMAFFFVSSSSRSNLLDTSLRTAKSGYLARQLVKSMEQFKTEYDYTVRRYNGVIASFVYPLGCLADKLINTKITFHEKNNEEFLAAFC